MTYSVRKLLATTLLASSSLANAQPTVELIWRSTTGTGSPGTNSIVATAGDVLVLDILVNGEPTSGLVGANLKLAWTDGITGYDAVECPSPPNAMVGQCADSLGRVFQPPFPGVTTTVGFADSFDAEVTGAFPLPGYYGEAMYLGSIKFHVDFDSLSRVEVRYGNTPLRRSMGLLPAI